MAGRQRVPECVLDYIRQVEGSNHADDALAEVADVDPQLVIEFSERIRESKHTVEDRYATGKTRGSAQRAFAAAVKTSYGHRCAITGISTPAFLVASHIVPWAADETTRLDPANGICLSTLVDRAFDRGFLSIDEDSIVHVEQARIDDAGLLSALTPYDGQRLAKPSNSPPNPHYLRRRIETPLGSLFVEGPAFEEPSTAENSCIRW